MQGATTAMGEPGREASNQAIDKLAAGDTAAAMTAFVLATEGMAGVLETTASNKATPATAAMVATPDTTATTEATVGVADAETAPAPTAIAQTGGDLTA